MKERMTRLHAATEKRGDPHKYFARAVEEAEDGD